MKNSMKKFFTRRNIIVGIVLLILIIGGFSVFSKGKSETTDITVQPGDFVQKVSISGQVVAAESVDLTFPESGRITSVPVKVGDKVNAGQTLVSIESGTLFAQLRSAEADLAKRRAEAQNTETNLDKIINEQNTLVSNAHAKLLSEDLIAASSLTRGSDITPPTISGLYTGEAGTYRLRIERGDTPTPNNYDLRVTGLENTERIKISLNSPTKIGTKGLYVSFSEELSVYNNTSWNVTIPNVNGANYLANYQAYQEALRTRDREIAAARADLAGQTSGITVAQADIKQAEAEVLRLQTEIANRTLRAPFTGIVTLVDAKVGGVVSAGTVAVSLISADTLQIESYVAEINIPFIEVGDNAEVTLDAYGDDLPLSAKVISIDPAETIRDGVSTYRIKLEFNSDDPRIKSGMTANVVITAEEKSDVISVPVGIVINRDGKKFVPVKVGDKTTEVEVKAGAISSLGMIEIISGLNPGDVVVIKND